MSGQDNTSEHITVDISRASVHECWPWLERLLVARDSGEAATRRELGDIVGAMLSNASPETIATRVASLAWLLDYAVYTAETLAEKAGAPPSNRAALAGILERSLANAIQLLELDAELDAIVLASDWLPSP